MMFQKQNITSCVSGKTLSNVGLKKSHYICYIWILRSPLMKTTLAVSMV